MEKNKDPLAPPPPKKTHTDTPLLSPLFIFFHQSSLVLDAARLACAMLAPGGTFVTKVFRSKDYTALLYALKQLFARVDATKPPASRSTSAEIFVVCRGYKAPARLDPRILDARHLFKDSGGAGAEGEAGGGNDDGPLSNSAGPDALLAARLKRGRARSGYAEGVALVRVVLPAAAFIMGAAPVEALGRATVLQLEGGGAAGPVPAALAAGLEADGEGVAVIDAATAAAVASHPATTAEVRLLCADLGVLGRSEFKALLKWRAGVRKALVAAPAAAAKKAAEAARAAAVAEAEGAASDDDELKEDAILDEIADAKGRADAVAKREKKRAREAKKKARLRAAAALAADGIADGGAEEGLFSLATLEKAGARARRAAAAAGGDLGSVPVPDGGGDDGDEHRWASSDGEEAAAAAAAAAAADGGDIDAAAARYAAATEAALDEAYTSYLSRQGRRAAAAAEKEAAASARKRARFGDEEGGGELGEEGEAGGAGGGLATAPATGDDPSDDDDDDEGGGGGGGGLGLLTDLDGSQPAAMAPGAGGGGRSGAPAGTTLAARWFGADPLFAEDDAAAVAAGDGGSDDDAALEAKAGAAAARRRGPAVVAAAAAAPPTPARAGGAATLLKTAALPSTRHASAYEEVPASPSRDSTSSDDSGGGGDATSDDEGAGSDGGLSTLHPWERAATLATARAALRGRRRADILDAGYHRFAFNDPDGGAGLPAWFTDDERRHMRAPELVTPAEIAAERAATAAIDARPIKKVAQARQRKAKRLTSRLEAARKKAEAIVEGGGGGEDLGAKGKAREVAKLYARARAGAGALKSGKKMSRSAKYTADKKGKCLDARLRADQRGGGAKGKKGGGGGGKGGGKGGGGGGKGKAGGGKGKGGGAAAGGGKSRKAGVAKRGRR